MADGKTNIEIRLRSTADVSGVEALNASLGITATREKELAALRSQFMSAADAEIAKINSLKDAAMAQAKAQAEVNDMVEASLRKVRERGALLQERPVAAVNPWASTGQSSQIAMFSQYRQTLLGAAEASEKVAAAQGKIPGAAGNSGLALLQLSRAAQDAQYGFAGVANNLEGIAMALGLGGGIAGAMTLVAVAVQTLGPKFAEWFASLDKEGTKLTALKSAHLGLAEAIQASFNPAEEAAKQASEAFTKQLQQEKIATDNNKAAIDAEIASLRLRNQIQDSSEDYAQRMKIEAVRASNLSPEETAKQEAAINLDFASKKAARAEELARQEEGAQLAKIAKDKELVAKLEAQLAAQNRIAKNAEEMLDLLNPANPGSIAGLQARLQKLDQQGSGNVYSPDEERRRAADRQRFTTAIQQRQAMLGNLAGQLPGGTLDISGTEKGKERNTATFAELKQQINQLKGEVEASKAGVGKAQTAFDQGAEQRSLQAQQRAQALEAQQRDILGRAGLSPSVVPSVQPRLPWELPGLPGALPGLPAGTRPLGLNDSALFPPLDSVRAPQGAPPAAFGSSPFGGGDIKAAGEKAAGAITSLKEEFLNAIGVVQQTAEKAVQQIKNSSGRSGS